MKILDWKFIKKDIDNAQTIDFSTDNWEKITVPHTWNRVDALRYQNIKFGFIKKKQGYYQGVGWYRTTFKIPKDHVDDRIFIRFEAVSISSEVYVNGKLVGIHHGGFCAFCYEITHRVHKDKENVIAVKADNTRTGKVPPISGDFPVMGGIYRPVSLFFKKQNCISPLDYASNGVYVHQWSICDDYVVAKVKVMLSCKKPLNGNLYVEISIFDIEKTLVIQEKRHITKYSLIKGYFSLPIQIDNPHLWNGIDDPYLYSIEVKMYEDDNCVDTVSDTIGFRYYEIESEKGFFLNGKSYPLYGVCRHQDREEKAWAISENDQDEDMQLIYEMGAKAIRLAHYPHSEYFYKLCDKKGLLVWAEIPLVNQVKFDKEFFKNSETMLKELIKQNFNRPSIFTWGLGNELGLIQLKDPSPVIKKLNQIAHKIDNYRPTTLATIGQATFRKKLNHSTDIIAVNTYPGWYYKHADAMKDKLEKWNKLGSYRGLGVSEYGAGAGITQHEEDPEPEGGFKMAFGQWHPEELQSRVHEITFTHIKNTPYVWGSFLWNMFDFAVPFRNEGDSPGRNDKGLVTYDRKVRKDAYFFYQANLSDKPMVYITSRRFTVRKTSETYVKVYSNCDTNELYVNGDNLGEMENCGMKIFKTQKITLKSGENHIKVIGSYDEVQITDECNWKLEN